MIEAAQLDAKFDAVVIARPDGSRQQVSAAEFTSMPLTERVVLVSRGLAKFFKNGAAVPAVEALRR